jgi:uncharacterized membrane protein YedE/YeeE
LLFAAAAILNLVPSLVVEFIQSPLGTGLLFIGIGAALVYAAFADARLPDEARKGTTHLYRFSSACVMTLAQPGNSAGLIAAFGYLGIHEGTHLLPMLVGYVTGTFGVTLIIVELLARLGEVLGRRHIAKATMFAGAASMLVGLGHALGVVSYAALP